MRKTEYTPTTKAVILTVLKLSLDEPTKAPFTTDCLSLSVILTTRSKHPAFIFENKTNHQHCPRDYANTKSHQYCDTYIHFSGAWQLMVTARDFIIK